LFAEQAATSQQMDQAEREVRVLTDQIKAQEEQIRAHERQMAGVGDQISAARAQQRTIAQQVTSAEAQVGQIAERIRKSDVRNPAAGTVLTSYAEAGEMVQVGQPLYRIANLGVMDVRAYVTEPQLATVSLGQDAVVSIDAGSSQRRTMTGKVTWISAQAEFTPTPIQTREERADLVYAIKIRVPNDSGILKIGMPVDVQFAGRPESQ
jgi:HlyD family secretion protein